MSRCVVRMFGLRRDMQLFQLGGVLEVVLVEDLLDVEVVAGVLLVGVLDFDIVEVWLFVLVVYGFYSFQVEEVIFVLRGYHDPGVVAVEACAAAGDDEEQMVELVLPDACEVGASFLLVGEDAVVELAEIDGVFPDGLLGVFEDAFALGWREFFFAEKGSEGFKLFRAVGLAVGVEIFLKEGAVVEVLVLRRGHGGVAAQEGFEESGVVVLRVLVDGGLLYGLEVGLAERSAGVACGGVAEQGGCGENGGE